MRKSEEGGLQGEGETVVRIKNENILKLAQLQIIIIIFIIIIINKHNC